MELAASVLDVIIPGVGTMLTELQKRCSSLRDAKASSDETCRRLQTVQAQIDHMVQLQHLPDPNVSDEFKEIITRLLQAVTQYENQCVLHQFVSVRQLEDRFQAENAAIDIVFKKLQLSLVAEVAEWRRKWEADQQEIHTEVQTMTQNNTLILREMRWMQRQVEEINTSRFETKKLPSYSVEYSQKPNEGATAGLPYEITETTDNTPQEWSTSSSVNLQHHIASVSGAVASGGTPFNQNNNVSYSEAITTRQDSTMYHRVTDAPLTQSMQYAIDLVRENVVRSLNLNRCSLGVSGVYMLAHALKQNTALRWVDLGNNNIGDDGAQALAETMRVNYALEGLYLGRNGIGDAGGSALAEAVRHNTALQQIGLHSNKITADGAKAWAETLECNNVIQTVYVHGNPLGECGTAILNRFAYSRVSFHQ